MNNHYDFTDEQKRELEKKDEEIKKLEEERRVSQQKQEDEENEWQEKHSSNNYIVSILESQVQQASILNSKFNSIYLPPISTPNSLSKLQSGVQVITAFDEYVLDKQVGQGGCGRVFLATNTDKESVAIKFLDRNIGKTKLKRFKNEIYFCEHNSHKNIVRVLDHGFWALDKSEYLFCVMPYYEQSLRHKIDSGILPKDAIHIFVGLLEGLEFAHNKGIIHRDIKPENILFAKNSINPVICDFGIAHFLVEDMETIVETKTTERLANFLYSAPEQRIKGGQAVFQSDIFAVGLILNEMFTHSVPQAVEYKRIKDCFPEYGFLDSLVDKIYKNKPQERLFPEKNILSELKMMCEENIKNEEIPLSVFK